VHVEAIVRFLSVVEVPPLLVPQLLLSFFLNYLVRLLSVSPPVDPVGNRVNLHIVVMRVPKLQLSFRLTGFTRVSLTAVSMVMVMMLFL
jgi:hypothetical protein